MIKFKKTVVAATAIIAVAGCVTGMTACGEGDKNIGAGTYSYNHTTVSEDGYGYVYDFGASEGMTRALDVKLTLKDDNTFELNANGYMIEDTEGGTVAVGEKFPFGDVMYCEWFSKFTGTYTSTADTVTITANYGWYKLPDLGASYLSQMFGNGSKYSKLTDGDYYYGEWDTTSTVDGVAEGILAQCPVTTFNIADGAISNWVESGFAVSVAETDGDGRIYFYTDDSSFCVFAGSECTKGTYAVSGGTVTLTSGENTWTGSADKALAVTLGENSASFTLTEDNITALTGSQSA